MTKRSNKYNRRTGFTLVELLVVIAIIGLLMTLILPSTRMMIDKGAASQCRSNMKQIGVSAFLFAADYEGRIPGVEGVLAGPHFASENPNGYSFVQELQLYQQGEKSVYGARKLPHFVCPRHRRSTGISDDLRMVSYKPPLAPWLRTTLWRFGVRYAGSSSSARVIGGIYAGNYMLRHSQMPLTQGKQLSDVVMLGEVDATNEGRIRRNNPAFMRYDLDGGRIMDFNVRLSHNKERGANFLFFDGHVELLSDYEAEFSKTGSMQENGTQWYMDH